MKTLEEFPLSVVAVLPGPRNGMTLMTDRIVNLMEQSSSLRLFDIGRSFVKVGKGWQLRKFSSSLLASFAIIFWRPRSGEKLYLVLNSHGGLYYNLAQAFAGRLRGFELVVHHHVWSYLSKPDWRLRLIIRIVGGGVHVVACPEMSEKLSAVYQRPLRFAYVTPGIVGPPEIPEERVISKNSTDVFQIGMLSNLTMEKGVGLALATFEELKRRGLVVKITLAGPVTDQTAQRVIESAIDRWPDSVEHLGPVYGDQKEDFFSTLDAFIFPTQYRNESWGIVLNEALMSGVPVISSVRGCTKYLVGELGGLVVDQDEAFVSEASDQISEWIDNPDRHQQAINDSLTRGRQIRSQAERQLEQFVRAFKDGRWPTEFCGENE